MFSLSLELKLVDGFELGLSFTRPLKLNVGATTLSLSRRVENGRSDNGFVRMLATWSFPEINRTKSVLDATISRTKWKSILTCLVRARKIGFADR
jgi:hypothetical protein